MIYQKETFLIIIKIVASTACGILFFSCSNSTSSHSSKIMSVEEAKKRTDANAQANSEGSSIDDESENYNAEGEIKNSKSAASNANLNEPKGLLDSNFETTKSFHAQTWDQLHEPSSVGYFKHIFELVKVEQGKLLAVGVSAEAANKQTSDEQDFTATIWKLSSEGNILFDEFDKGFLQFKNITGETKYSRAFTALTDSTGHYIFAGSLQTMAASEKDPTQRAIIWRSDKSGKIDLSFGQDGQLELFKNSPSYISKIVSDSKDNYFFVGLFDSHEKWVGKIKKNGELDTSFGNGGFIEWKNKNQIMTVKNILIDSKNHLYVIGHVNLGAGQFSLGIAKFLEDGTPELKYGDKGLYLYSSSQLKVSSNGGSYPAVLDSNENIIVAINARSVIEAKSTTPYLLKLDAQGKPVENFGLQGAGEIPLDNLADGVQNQEKMVQSQGQESEVDPFEINQIIIQNNEKILVSGFSPCVKGFCRSYLWRLDSDGQRDVSFASNGILQMPTLKDPDATGPTPLITYLQDTKILMIENSGKPLYYIDTNSHLIQ